MSRKPVKTTEPTPAPKLKLARNAPTRKQQKAAQDKLAAAAQPVEPAAPNHISGAMQELIDIIKEAAADRVAVAVRELTASAAPPAPDSVQQIPVAHIRPGDNDRKHFDENALNDLAASIKTHGLAQPITVRPMDDGAWFQVVAGERRFRAISQVLGWDTVPCLVRSLNDEEAAAIMLVENTARVDLDPIAEARAFHVRAERFGWSAAKIAETAGVSVERVKNRLALLTLADDIQHFIRVGQFPQGHALLLVDLDKDRQRIAIRAFNAARSMPLPRFQEIVSQLRHDMLAEQQQNMFELELQIMDAIDTDQFALRGRRARTGAPIDSKLPAVKVASTDTTGDILDRYVQQLMAAGLPDAAAAVGTIYTALVAVNCAAVPVNSILAKTADPAAVAEAVVSIEKI